jgi:hypothetical protein
MNELVRTLCAIVNTPEINAALSGSSHGESLSIAMQEGVPEYICEYAQITLIDVAQRIQALGFSLVGNGNFAVVLAHPDYPDVVFKVCTDMDDKYHAFVQYCESACTPHIPVVHAKDVREFAAVYVLDKLIAHDKTTSTISATQIRARVSQSVLTCARGVPRKVKASPMYPRKLMVAARRLAKWVHRNNFGWDLHEDNIMWHPKTGALVITDPVY